MATILDKFNELIAGSLQNNLYSSEKTYIDALKSRPDLGSNAHPHSNIANTIPGPSSTPPAEMHSPPVPSRHQIYVKSNDLAHLPVPTNIPSMVDDTVSPPNVNASLFPPGTSEKISRNEIYAKSSDLNRISELPPADSLDFTQKLTHPHEGQQPHVIPSDVNQGIGGTFKTGYSPSQHGPPALDRNEIYKKTDPINATVQIPPAVESDQKLLMQTEGVKSINDPNKTIGASQFVTPRDEIYKSSVALQGKEALPIPPTIQSIVDTAGKFPSVGDIQKRGDDSHNGGNYYDDRGPSLFAREGKFGWDGLPQQLGYFDIFATAHQLRSVLTEFGVLGDPGTNNGKRAGDRIAKGITFLASQFLLTAMNPSGLELGAGNFAYNPLHIVASFVPLARSTPLGTAPTAAAALNLTYDATIAGKDNERLLLMRQGVYVKPPDGTGISKITEAVYPPGFIGDLNGVTQQNLGTIPNAASTIEAQTDLGISNATLTNLYTSEDGSYGRLNRKNDLATITKETLDKYGKAERPEDVDKKINAEVIKKLFKGKSRPGGEALADNARNYAWYPFTDVVNTIAAGGVKSVSLMEKDSQNINARFDMYAPSPEIDGMVPNAPINDDELYMPFMFQDLRETPPKFLYFRAFLKPESLNQTFTPDWQAEKYYGRIDAVPVYMGTSRNISLAFDVVAWGPADLPVIYKKMHKLQSMVYPEFDSQGSLKAAPIIRMRVGDLFSSSPTADGKDAGKLGLPGYITSLDFSYDDGVWNVETDFKVPRKVTISLNFTVIHQGNPGIYPTAMDKNEKSFGTGYYNANKKEFVGVEAGFGKVVSAANDFMREKKYNPGT
jgi:hypothetical protein